MSDEAGDSAQLVSDAAYLEIQRLITVGNLRPYELLSENDLARRLGCGRTPVREALQRLKYEGFVDILPRRGIMVTPVDIHRQLELLEVRRPLEEVMVQLAASRASTAERERMRALAIELENAMATGDRGRFFSINREIHLLEAVATRNRYLKREIGVLHSLSRRFWYTAINEADSFARAADHHARTLRAIAGGDPVAAARECRDLLNLLEALARQAIETRGTLREPLSD